MPILLFRGGVSFINGKAQYNCNDAHARSGSFAGDLAGYSIWRSVS